MKRGEAAEQIARRGWYWEEAKKGAQSGAARVRKRKAFSFLPFFFVAAWTKKNGYKIMYLNRILVI